MVCVIIDNSACTTIVLDDNGRYTTAALDIVDGSGQITVTANVAAKWAGHAIGQVHSIRPAKSMSQIGG